MPVPGPSFDSTRMARLRSRKAGYLTDSLTNSRTSATVPCRVALDTRDEHYEGLGRLIETKRCRIVQPWGTDVKAGDILTVAGRGTYCALETLSDSTNAASATVFAFQQRLADGSLNLLQNLTVSVLGTDRVTRSVRMFGQPVGEDAIIRDPSLLRAWIFAWDPLLPAGHPIIAGTRFDWTVNGIPMNGNTREIMPNANPYIHSTAYVQQVLSSL